MPKIISGLDTKLLSIAKKIVSAEGYDALSMKAIAKESKIAVGTIYNYYPDKNSLLSDIVADNWKILSSSLESKIEGLATVEEGIKLLYEAFISFSLEHQSLFAHLTTSGNAAYYASYKNFIEEGARLLEKITLRFGEKHNQKNFQLAASMFSFAIHFPDTPYEIIEESIRKLL